MLIQLATDINRILHIMQIFVSFFPLYDNFLFVIFMKSLTAGVRYISERLVYFFYLGVT